jgi:ribonuclease HI
MQTRKLVLVFDGGSKGNPGMGYGSYAVTVDDKTTITRLEFGNGVTNNEAEYDTFITALETLIKQFDTGQINLEARGDSQLVIYQVLGKWKARDSRMRARRDRVRELLRHYKSFRLVLQPREDSVRVLGH